MSHPTVSKLPKRVSFDLATEGEETKFRHLKRMKEDYFLNPFSLIEDTLGTSNIASTWPDNAIKARRILMKTKDKEGVYSACFLNNNAFLYNLCNKKLPLYLKRTLIHFKYAPTKKSVCALARGMLELITGKSASELMGRGDNPFTCGGDILRQPIYSTQLKAQQLRKLAKKKAEQLQARFEPVVTQDMEGEKEYKCPECITKWSLKKFHQDNFDEVVGCSMCLCRQCGYSAFIMDGVRKCFCEDYPPHACDDCGTPWVEAIAKIDNGRRNCPACVCIHCKGRVIHCGGCV